MHAVPSHDLIGRLAENWYNLIADVLEFPQGRYVMFALKHPHGFIHIIRADSIVVSSQ